MAFHPRPETSGCCARVSCIRSPERFRAAPRTRRSRTMPFLFWDPTYLLLIPAILFAMWAQWKVQSTYNQMSQVRAANGMTGRDMARAIMSRNGIADVGIEEVDG